MPIKIILVPVFWHSITLSRQFRCREELSPCVRVVRIESWSSIQILCSTVDAPIYWISHCFIVIIMKHHPHLIVSCVSRRASSAATKPESPRSATGWRGSSWPKKSRRQCARRRGRRRSNFWKARKARGVLGESQILSKTWKKNTKQHSTTHRAVPLLLIDHRCEDGRFCCVRELRGNFKPRLAFQEWKRVNSWNKKLKKH